MDAVRPIAMINNQKGMTLVYVAICIVILCGFLGLAVDLGHMQVVRGELQNAADAAALAGASRLYAVSEDTPTLDWNAATSAATAFISENKSDNAALADGTVEVGYWNLSWDPATNPPLIPATTAPGSLTTDDIAAVKVTISRSAGSNGGPVDTFFMKALGVDNAPVGSRPAVAAVGFTGSVPVGTLFPLAIAECVTNFYFNPDNPIPDPPPTIRFSSPSTLYSNGGPNCYTGQWTTLQSSPEMGTSTISALTTNSTPLKVSDQIFTVDATSNRNALYKDVKDLLPAGGEGKDVLLAIVNGNVRDSGLRPIKGFATFHIDRADNGSNPFVEGHFVNFETVGTGLGGSPSNTYKMQMIR